MLSSIVLAFLAGRLSTQTEPPVTVVKLARHRVVRSIVLELFAWSLVALSSGALIWIIAPFVVAALHFCSPVLASHLNFVPPAGCSAAQGNWFVVKRVMIGYLALCLVCAVLFACWFAAAHWFESKSGKVAPRWSVILDESEHD
ncbi:hypothetical protein AWB69_08937 [Caballeronia udeis]|uniref:Uncharacterized protein n=1 Tax=Caballeronia udeis TaxID=1232866 RepID=A0A158JWH2_9BURK|nr:hypothetical protein [Caballeronia udeis]SAL73168.1 hypothetical protein AWB69_08937 [Caballeronia udeis]